MKQAIKRRLCTLALPVLLAGLTACGGAPDYTPAAREPEFTVTVTDYASLGYEDGWDIAARNDRFALCLDAATATVAVRDSRTGQLWKTNAVPGDYGEDVSAETAGQYRSPLSLTYYDKREKMSVYHAYAQSIADGKFDIRGIEDGVRIVFQIGGDDEIYFASVLTQSTMEETILPRLEEEEREQLLQYYILTRYEDLGDANRDNTVEKYPIIKTEPVYLPKPLHVSIRRKLIALFIKAGVTAESLNAEYEKIGFEQRVTPAASFTVPVDYRLTADGLIARAAVGEIEYDKAQYTLTKIDFLPYFGCGLESEEGYMLVPDGSGSLVDFTARADDPVSFPVYGSDHANAVDSQAAPSHGQQAVLPAFGVHKQGAGDRPDSGFAALIAEGDALASIQCQPVSDIRRLPAVFASFEIRRREVYASENLLNTNEMVKYARAAYEGDIRVEYRFLAGEDAGYAGMARSVRERLFAGASPLAEDTLPLYVDTYGVVTRDERLLGIPVQRQRALTTYGQAQDMLEQLTAAVDGPVTLRYRNWSQDAGRGVLEKLGGASSTLGGAGSLKALLEWGAGQNVRIYADLDLLHDSKGGFSSSGNARRIDGSQATYTRPGVAAEAYDDAAGSLMVKSLDAVRQQAGRIAGKAEGLGFTHLSLSTAGACLNSDYNDNHSILRPEAQARVAALLAEMSGFSLMADAGNAYVLPYVGDVLDLPLSDSRLLVESRSVPFVPMALHGYVRYAGRPLNLGDNYEGELLRAVEYGGGLRYTLNSADPSMLKNTAYTELYSTNFDYWKDTVAADAARAAAVLDGLAGARMLSHEQVSEGVFVVGYEGGGRVAVNYTREPVEIDGHTLPGRDFARLDP